MYFRFLFVGSVFEYRGYRSPAFDRKQEKQAAWGKPTSGVPDPPPSLSDVWLVYRPVQPGRFGDVVF